MHPADTGLGGSTKGFPTTRWTQLLKTVNSNERQEYLTFFFRRYWKPVYQYIRVAWKKSNEDTKDLTQEFFSYLLEKDVLRQANPGRGRLRSFIKACLKNFLLRYNDYVEALKRGGAVKVFSLEDVNLTEVAGEDVSESEEESFDQSWLLALVQQGVGMIRQDLEAIGRARDFEMFQVHDVDPPPAGRPSYTELAHAYGIPEQTVKSSLDYVRTLLRKRIRELIDDYCETEEEAKEEFHTFFPQ